MYITETGIADARDDRRALFIDSYFKEVHMLVVTVVLCSVYVVCV